MDSYWQHQKNEPLFPDVIWSRPETQHGAGKLAIIGGSAGSMANIAASYTAAETAGAGTMCLLVPKSVAKITSHIPHIQYAASTPSGGFAREALAELLDTANRSDGVLLAGDMGKNSETSQLLDTFLEKYEGHVIISSGSLESVTLGIRFLLSRSNTVLCISMKDLRDAAIELQSKTAVTSGMPRQMFAGLLKELSLQSEAVIIVEKEGTVWVAENGRVADCENIAYNCAKAAVWIIQQPNKRFEAIVSSVL